MISFAIAINGTSLENKVSILVLILQQHIRPPSGTLTQPTSQQAVASPHVNVLLAINTGTNRFDFLFVPMLVEIKIGFSYPS